MPRRLWLIELIFLELVSFECCFLFHCACVISIRNVCVEWCLAKGFNWTEGYLKAQHAGRCSIQVNVFIVVATKPLCIKLHTLSFYLLETQGTKISWTQSLQVRVIVHLWYRNINILLMFQVIAYLDFLLKDHINTKRRFLEISHITHLDVYMFWYLLLLCFLWLFDPVHHLYIRIGQPGLIKNVPLCTF